MESAEKCSKCEGQLDTEGTPKWCLKCRAKYQREYKAVRMEMEGGKGFGRGVEAMRDLLAEEFERFGAAGFSGIEAAFYIRQAPGPAKD